MNISEISSEGTLKMVRTKTDRDHTFRMTELKQEIEDQLIVIKDEKARRCHVKMADKLVKIPREVPGISVSSGSACFILAKFSFGKVEPE